MNPHQTYTLWRKRSPNETTVIKADHPYHAINIYLEKQGLLMPENDLMISPSYIDCNSQGVLAGIYMIAQLESHTKYFPNIEETRKLENEILERQIWDLQCFYGLQSLENEYGSNSK